ncbi:response regulator [Teredinibacter purpureus]|uniref:response regulator n=1 Tax=Teredinibacter purpureus TaxID=2731756 RepID=UPI0005F7877F|nr:response regulator [Teredinibacter purpureus]
MALKPAKILLIEDNPGDIELVRTGFEDAHIANQLDVIEDGQIALDYIEEGRNLPDIILLDINLPKIDGFEILAAIRNNPASHRIPVIMLTSSDAGEDVARSYQHSANSYVTKPIDFDKFLLAVKSIEEFWLSVVKLPLNTHR